jgi:hypothetical protein
MSRFVAVDRETSYLLPPSVDEWLPEDHLARFVVEVIDKLDLSELTRKYAGRGSDAHHPAVLLGLLVYGYASGVFSSRKIERASYDSVAFRFGGGREGQTQTLYLNLAALRLTARLATLSASQFNVACAKRVVDADPTATSRPQSHRQFFQTAG